MSSCGDEVIEGVKQYYGKILQKSEDLSTNACKSSRASIPPHVCRALSQVHEEVVSKYYGCGIVAPQLIEDASIVDLGCGTGRDVYALSKLAGPRGHVTGVDMTEEQLEIAQRYVDYHAQKFGFANVKFVKGYVEDLKSVEIADSTIDIGVSNCVVNLCQDKKKVLNEVYRVLKYGGEFYFSDIYCDRVLNDSIRNHPQHQQVLWNEGLSGSLFWKDFYKLCSEVGFETPRIYSVRKFEIEKDSLKKLVEGAQYVAVVYRLFKIDKIKADKKGRKVVYDGGITGFPEAIKFDYKLNLVKDQPTDIGSDTWNCINQSRFAKHFKSNASSSFTTETDAEDPFEVVSRCGEKSAKCAGS